MTRSVGQTGKKFIHYISISTCFPLTFIDANYAIEKACTIFANVIH